MSTQQMTPRRLFLIALVPAVLLGARLAKSEVAVFATPDGGSWEMVIEPARPLADVDAAALVPPAPQPVIEPVLPSPVRHGRFVENALGSRSTTEAAEDDQDKPASPVALQEGQVPPPADPGEIGIEIVPNESSTAAEEGARRYRNIYEAIPFSRTEYLANPSYRQETTMELLFGELRPMTIHKVQRPQVHHDRVPLSAVPYPYRAYPYAEFDYWQYRDPAFQYFLPYGVPPQLLDY